jgi:uncharacterized protein (TIGR03083 family)
MDDPLPALHVSVDRLTRLVGQLDDAQLMAPSYCPGWTVADVLSHLGSGGVIQQRHLADALAGTATPEGLNQAVWDEWNAKTPRAQADDSLKIDGTLLAALHALSAEDRARPAITFGPVTLTVDQAIGMRLNEHTLHTWDVEVVFDKAAVLPPAETSVVVDNLGMIARFVARPTGDVRDVHVHTTGPDRDFTVHLSADAAVLEAGGTADADVVMPAESFCRLVYGRLNPDHTPAGVEGAELILLRLAFPGP